MWVIVKAGKLYLPLEYSSHVQKQHICCIVLHSIVQKINYIFVHKNTEKP